MRTCLLLLASLCVLNGHAQTSRRSIIPGTWCSMEPAPGFIPAKRFNGFEHVSGNAAVMLSVLSSSVESNTKSLTNEALETRGMKLQGKTLVPVGQTQATLFEVTQANNAVLYRKFMLVFGDTSKTVFVDAGAPDSLKVLCAQLKEMVLSTVYDTSQRANETDLLPFTIDTAGTGFKAARSTTSGVIYTMDGVLPSRYPGKPRFTAGISVRKVDTGDKKAWALKRLAALPGLDSLLSHKTDTITLDGLSGYATDAVYRNQEKEEEKVYMVILYDLQGDYYILAGTYAGEDKKYASLFRKMIAGFQRKK
ncbi:MAG: hypothetical protein JNL88_00895 [Bacteroidia bacterium]|nr:hypothetical protein [Bacteroidia bacterium]